MSDVQSGQPQAQPEGAPTTSGAALLGGEAPKANGAVKANGHAGTEATPGQTGDGRWWASFEQGLDDEVREPFGKLAARYKSPADLAKAHVNLVRTMDQRIPLPGKDAKPEEWDEVYQKLGMPEKPDGYKFNFEGTGLAQAEQEQIKGLAPLFRQARATQAQVDAFVKHQAEMNRAAAKAWEARAAELARERAAELRQRWPGDKFEEEHRHYRVAVKHYAGESLPELAQLRLDDGTYVMDHPAIAEAFARAGRDLVEDGRDPSGVGSAMSRSIDQQIQAIEDEMLEKGISPLDPQYPHAKLEALYAKRPGAMRNKFGR